MLFPVFKSIFKNLIKYIITLNPLIRKLIFITTDFSIIYISFILKDFLNYEKVDYENQFFVINTIFIILIFILSGHYRSSSRYESSREIYSLSIKNFGIVILLYGLQNQFTINISNLKSWFEFWLLITSLIGTSRIISRDLIAFALKKEKRKVKKLVAIFGTDNESQYIFDYINNLGNYKVKFFIDDSSHLTGYKIKGIEIINSTKLSNLSIDLDQIFIMSEDIKKKNIQNILNYAKKQNIDIIKIPPIEQLTPGIVNVQELKPLEVEDLLFRDKVTSSYKNVKKELKNKSICIIGAGGSIGSELSTQIIKYEPKRIILYDISEINLYEIDSILNNINQKNINIIPILGDACDAEYLKSIFNKFEVDIIFHTAAYKHVPLVEKNPIKGLYNNVFSTFSICSAAEKLKIEKVITISTDKAVRPTNIMGASKRISELIVQGFSEKINNSSQRNKTIYSMVRFGNVLKSSGSVVPLFKKQIHRGGPVTITHPEITRYFMTINEAALLVLETSIIAEGGEIYLLDMGKPIKIKELAIEMIKKSGLSLKDENNINGDIEIISTGLRPGEKLFEELLINANAEKTSHPKIFKAREEFCSEKLLWPQIERLKKYIEKRNLKQVIEVSKKLVPEWQISNSLNVNLNKDNAL